RINCADLRAPISPVDADAEFDRVLLAAVGVCVRIGGREDLEVIVFARIQLAAIHVRLLTYRRVGSLWISRLMKHNVTYSVVSLGYVYGQRSVLRVVNLLTSG